jgi:hypothetical protein
VIDPEIRHEEGGPSDRTLRQFAATATVVSAAWALRAGFVQGRTWPALTVASIGMAVATIGVVRPRALLVVYSAAVAISKPIGAVVSFVLLALVYFLVLTPLALVFRVIGRDELRLRRPSGGDSHWGDVPPSNLSDYFRQS